MEEKSDLLKPPRPKKVKGVVMDSEEPVTPREIHAFMEQFFITYNQKSAAIDRMEDRKKFESVDKEEQKKTEDLRHELHDFQSTQAFSKEPDVGEPLKQMLIEEILNANAKTKDVLDTVVNAFVQACDAHHVRVDDKELLKILNDAHQRLEGHHGKTASAG